MPSLGRRNPTQSISLLMAKYARPKARPAQETPQAAQPRKVARLAAADVAPRRSVLPWVGLIAAIGLVATLYFMPATVRERLMPGLQGPRALLVQLAGEYRAAWRPEDKAAVLERAAAAQKQLRAPLRWLLAQHGHPFLVEGIQLAGALRAEWALAELKALRKVRPLRGSVLLAMDKIRPLSDQDLADLLAETDKKLLLVALGIGHAREVPPLLPMLRLLRHKEVEVRTAALAALPSRLPEEVLPVVLDLAGDRDELVAALGLQALARAPLPVGVEPFLGDIVARGESPLLHPALTALAARNQPLAPATTARIWQLLSAPGQQRRSLARAFLCLERTRSLDGTQAQRLLGELDGVGRYFVARHLLAAGDDAGLQLLFEMSEDGAGRAAVDASVRFAARGLLAGLSGTAAAVGEATWRAWFEAHPLSGPQELPAPLLDY